MRIFQVFLSLLCALLMAFSAFAETVKVLDNYAPVVPEITRFLPYGDMRLATLDCSFYISDDKI